MGSNEKVRWGYRLKAAVFFLSVLLFPFCQYANNIQVSNVALTGQNFAESFTHVRFDISWENSWRVSSSPENWDAAWVFVKYRKSGELDWHHAYLDNSGHTAPTGSQIDAGLVLPDAAFNASTNPAIGVFVYRSAQGIGNFSAEGIELRWNYAANPDEILDDPDLVEISVMAIEMVYVPEGAFYVGSGGEEEGRLFRAEDPTQPFQITSEGPITTASSGAGNLWGAGGLTGDNAVAQSDPSTIPADFPKGFKAIYCMKYNLNQEQYVSFLNKLTRTQQANRISTTIVNNFMSTVTSTAAPLNRNGVRLVEDAGAPLPRFYANDLNNNGIGNEEDDGQGIACNFVSWGDLVAYLDWSGLRPMTDLEFEKICRGPRFPIPNEFPWGTATVKNDGVRYVLNNPGTPDEGIESGYATGEGNAIYIETRAAAPDDGPMRVGILAAHPANSRRMTAGASFFGVMDMAGNMQERIVSIGLNAGRTYTGRHGDGRLTATGFADIPNLSASDAEGIGFRGGSWNSVVAFIRTSNRYAATLVRAPRLSTRGGRGVRTAP